jgi:hypothetical protein
VVELSKIGLPSDVKGMPPGIDPEASWAMREMYRVSGIVMVRQLCVNMFSKRISGLSQMELFDPLVRLEDAIGGVVVSGGKDFWRVD